MRFAVVGAGAVGAFVGAMLARAGEDVTLIARGAHLRAMQQNGVRVHGSLGEFLVRVPATDDPTDAGDVDVVFLALKAHSLTEMAPRLAPLLGPETTVVSAQNGVPWWYFHKHGGELEGMWLETVDPGGVIAGSLGPDRAVGCVLYCSTAITEPGVINHMESSRFAIGEPDGSKSERCQNISRAFIRSGLRCPIRRDIRHEVWVKLMGNAVFNPVSALTRATLVEITRCAETRQLASKIMSEVGRVAAALGIEIGVSDKQRLAGAEKVGHHKTSMLQDLEAGRPIELEPIVGAVIEIGTRLGISMPNTAAVYACTKLLVRSLENKGAQCLNDA
jgi:2-dehydropantoate 2-reductase